MGKTFAMFGGKLVTAALCVLFLTQLAPAAEAQGLRGFLQSFLPEPILDAFNLNDPPSEEALKNLLSESEVLKLEEPRSGFVGEKQADVLTFSVPTNGTEFPNLLLTLSVTNTGGDGDIYCVPAFLFNESGIVPSRAFALWGSAHSQGNDYVFISREDPQYPSAKVGLKEDRVNADGVSFVCSVHGYSANGAEYTVEIDIDYSDRSMVESEQEVMKEIFEQCCVGTPGQCSRWKSRFDENGDISMDFCHMPGSICNAEGRLIRLDLRKNGMQCEIPTASLVKLEALEKIQLANNELMGNIGGLLAGLQQALPNLQHLDLSSNLLTGDFSFEEEGESPLCKLTHEAGLAFLNMEFNGVTGKLPACIFDGTSQLKEIFLEGNALNSEMPEISEDSKIEILHLASVGLKGSIPSAVGSLKALVALELSDNELTGTLPESLGSSKSLKNIRVQGNKLEGAVPEAIATSESLKFVRLDKNSFTKLPEAWYGDNVASKKLAVLDASFNELEGEFPVALARATNLTYLSLHSNKLTGRLPAEEGMFQQTVVLDLGLNKFRGPLPESFGNAGMFDEGIRSNSVFLPSFDLSENKLTGRVPEFLYEQNLSKRMKRVILIGGNNFDLPCPVPAQLRYAQGLSCEDGETPAAPAPEEEMPVPAPEVEEGPEVEAPAPAPEQEEEPEEEAEEPAIVPVFPPPVVPEEESKSEPSMPEPESDTNLDELEGDGSGNVGFESLTDEVISAPLQNKDDSALDDPQNVKNRSFDNVSLSATSPDNEENAPAPKNKKVATGKTIGGVAVLGFLAILIVMVIAVVAVRRKRAQKTREVEEVLAPDVEMATPPAQREGDTVHMLEGVKSSG